MGACADGIRRTIICAPSAPPPPDYSAAARTQGAANVQSTIASAILNRPNQSTPLGSQTWNQTGTYTVPGAEGNAPVDIPLFTAETQLTPEGKRLQDSNLQTQQILADIGVSSADRAKSTLGTDVDFSGAPTVGTGADTRAAVRDAMLSRQMADIGRSRESANSNLIARGIAPGSKAYEVEMDRLGRQETDARTQADLAAGQEAQRQQQMDMGARQQAITEILAKRQTPLNEISAFRTGSQVQMPNFGVSGTNNQIAPAPVGNAAAQQGQAQQNLYNQQVGQQNATMGGLFNLGASALPFFL